MKAFKEQLLAGEFIVGALAKTPSLIVSDVLAQTQLDMVCLDTEHAPFDRVDLDACLFAYRAYGKPALVRVPSADPSHILNALDCGAAGVVVPHVDSKDKALRVARACRYGSGGRGYAGSSRAAGYGTQPVERTLEIGQAISVVAQIEDLGGVNDIESIVTVDGIDCLFIGMMDLTIACGATSPGDDTVVSLAERVCKVAVEAGRRVGIFVSDPSDIPFWRERGVSFFLMQSDHYFLQQGAASLAAVKARYTE